MDQVLKTTHSTAWPPTGEITSPPRWYEAALGVIGHENARITNTGDCPNSENSDNPQLVVSCPALSAQFAGYEMIQFVSYIDLPRTVDT